MTKQRMQDDCIYCKPQTN